MSEIQPAIDSQSSDNVVKEFPTADAQKLVDALKSAFVCSGESLMWRNQLSAIEGYSKAIERHPGIPDRMALCMVWLATIDRLVAPTVRWNSLGISVSGLSQAFESLTRIILDLKRLELIAEFREAPFRREALSLNDGIGPRFEKALWGVQNRLNLIVGPVTALLGKDGSIVGKRDSSPTQPPKKEGMKFKEGPGRKRKIAPYSVRVTIREQKVNGRTVPEIQEWLKEEKGIKVSRSVIYKETNLDD